MILTTYGRSSGFCVDPIEKSRSPTSIPVRRCCRLVRLAATCRANSAKTGTFPNRKRWIACQTRPVPDQIARAAVAKGAMSVAFTYNDPVIFAEYAMDTADACKQAGIKTVAVTAGYIHKEPRADFFAKMDAANVDLKDLANSSICGLPRRTFSRC